MDVGAIEPGATAGAKSPPRIAEELLPLPPVRAREPRAGRVLVALTALVACAAGASLIHARMAGPGEAGDAEAMAEVRHAVTAIEAFALENDGSYLGATGAALSLSEQVEVTAGPTWYVIVGHPGGTEREFSVSRGADGSTELGCLPAGTGACSSTGVWR